MYDIEINTEQAKIDVQEAKTNATMDYDKYNMDNLDEFLSEPEVLVEKVLTDNKVKEDIDEQLEIQAEKGNRTSIGTLKKDFQPEINASFDGGKNFEIYCRDNCLDNEILIHPR